MLNTVFTPPNQRIACSTTCGHLRPIVANTVSKKSMIAHLLIILYHEFDFLASQSCGVYGNCYNFPSGGLGLIFFVLLQPTQRGLLVYEKLAWSPEIFSKKKLIL